MKSWKLLTSLLLVGLLACPFPAAAAEGDQEVHGSVFFGGTGFDYSEDQVFQLERYGTNREGGDNQGGYLFFDAFDADFYLQNNGDDSHTVDISRDSFNYFDQRVEGRMNTDELEIKFRSTILESHIQDPVPGADSSWGAAAVGGHDTNYLARFNNDVDPDTIADGFHIERDSYEGSIRIKPAAYGHDGSIVGDLELYYRGYNRDGRRFFRYVLGGGDVGDVFHEARWRGIDQRVDENLDTAGVRSVFAPFHWFTLTNDTSIEEYDNHSAPFGLTDINFLFTSDVEGRRNTVNFIADTTKITTTTEAHTSIGDWLELRGGYTFMNLDQETFSHVIRDGSASNTSNETTRRYLTGRTDYHVATVGGIVVLAPWWTVNVQGRWELRDNRSSIDDSTAWHTLKTIIDPRIDQISDIEGTVETSINIPTMRTTLTGGWTRKRTNRDLQFADLCDACGPDHIMRGYTLHTSNTKQDIFFLTVASHPAPGWTARFRGNATTASDTGLITEDDVGFSGRVIVSYWANVLHGLNLSAHGQLKDFENDEKAFVDATGASFPMDHDGLFASGGFSASVNPTETTSLFATYTFISNELDTTFYRTDKRRFEERDSTSLDVNFRRIQSLSYDDSTHSVSGGVTQRLTDWWTVSASGVFTFSEGDKTNGELAEVLGRVDNTVDHVDYIATGSTEVSLGDGWGIAGEASHESFEDDIDPNKTGHINTFMASLFFTR